MIRSSNDETNFPRKLLLSNTQVSKIRRAFANGLSGNLKFSKTQYSKMIQSGGILGKLKKGISLVPKLAPALAGKATEY